VVGLASRTASFSGGCRTEYDVLITMDRGIEFQQNLATVSVSILLVRALSNRMMHLLPVVPAILEALPALKPGQVHRVGA
jgi:hypothetical protein